MRCMSAEKHGNTYCPVATQTDSTTCCSLHGQTQHHCTCSGRKHFSLKVCMPVQLNIKPSSMTDPYKTTSLLFADLPVYSAEDPDGWAGTIQDLELGGFLPAGDSQMLPSYSGPNWGLAERDDDGGQYGKGSHVVLCRCAELHVPSPCVAMYMADILEARLLFTWDRFMAVSIMKGKHHATLSRSRTLCLGIVMCAAQKLLKH